MKIFIGWSGERSRQLAKILYDWLPIVLQNVEPYMSEEMDKGTRWASGVAEELESSNFGLFCMTRENLDAPWIHFEAGALSKVVAQSYVVPILFNLMPSNIQGPMALFQSTGLEKSEMMRLMKTINKASSDEALEESRLERAFDGLWDKFTHGIKAVPENVPESKQEPPESTNPVLEEILVLSRQQTQMLASYESVSPFVYQIKEQIEELRHLLSVSALPDADQGVWYDLSRTWTRFLNTWERFTVSLKPEGEGLGATGMIRIREEDWRLLLDSIAELRRPIEFLTDRRTQRPPRSTSDRAWARLLNITRDTMRAPYAVRWIPQGGTESAGLQLPDLRSALDFACSIRKATATLPFADYWVEDISGSRVADKKRIEEHCLEHGLV